MDNNEQALLRTTPDEKTINWTFDTWDYPYYYNA